MVENLRKITISRISLPTQLTLGASGAWQGAASAPGANTWRTSRSSLSLAHMIMASPDSAWPALPARPTICFIFADTAHAVGLGVPPVAAVMVRRTTRWAGRLTPADSVEVAQRIRMVRLRNPTSMTARSSLVIPAWWKAIPRRMDCSKMGWTRHGDNRRSASSISTLESSCGGSPTSFASIETAFSHQLRVAQKIIVEIELLSDSRARAPNPSESVSVSGLSTRGAAAPPPPLPPLSMGKMDSLRLMHIRRSMGRKLHE